MITRDDFLTLFDGRDVLAQVENYETVTYTEDGQLVVELYGHTPFKRGFHIGTGIFELVTIEPPTGTADAADEALPADPSEVGA